MTDRIKDEVRERYRSAALTVLDDGAACCGADEPFGASLYGDLAPGAVPDAARMASLGCGNPTAIAALSPGQRVLDLGSGGGLDVFLAARRVGPDGFVWGVDMTPEMLQLARRNQAEAGITNVEFVAGEIEAIPLPDASVDVVISNCVINLSPDKDAVFREAHRVLRPGGRFAVTDVVRLDRDAAGVDPDRWAECISGAIHVDDYRDGLEAAGFSGVAIAITHTMDHGIANAEITALA